MVASIRSKIIVLTCSLLGLLALAVTGAAFLAFNHDKEMMISAGGLSISSLAGQINKDISTLEDNARDLALMGEVHYKAGKQDAIGKELVSRIFQNYPHSLGGGIWFKPYALYPDRERSCLYAFKNQDNQVVVDNAFESASYNYPSQSWYTEIMAQLEQGQKVAWSKPYYENQGAYTLMTTVGSGIYLDGKLIGLSTVDWEMDTILNAILKIKPTPGSFVLFADKSNDYIIAGTESDAQTGKSLKTLDWYSDSLTEGHSFSYRGKGYIPYIKQLDNGFFLIVAVPINELFYGVLHHFGVLLTLLLCSTLFIVLILYWVLNRNINRPIAKLTQLAQQIGQGNLNTQIYLDKPSELAHLASVFNQMTQDIKTHIIRLSQISLAKEKIESELAIAHTIQKSALPQDFPKNDSFELVASMTPANEVGGDFYDFFPIDEDHFGFVMADVSGKGITAALYMMSAKTAIKNMLQAKYPLTDAINRVNKVLCENHTRGMFVTAFIGILNIKTGTIDYVNAGHCPPLRRAKGKYDYLPVVRNLVLGITPTYRYEGGTFTLKSSERLFLYTDGVTEAQTRDKKLFGPDRLKTLLNRRDYSLVDTISCVHRGINRFVRGAEQSDDITIMVIEFKKKK
ncbi:MAG: SpoIIE family protein phosphatase [Pseudomonadota bacterium]|nr:SpoIIE family protein phosphatase [Pseudomonadota bacterium]